MTGQLDEQERSQLALLVMDIFDQWKLEMDDRIQLLGLPEKSAGRTLSKLRNGAPLPETDEVLERAKHVLGIQEALGLIFPHNGKMPAFWLRNRHRQFRTSPLALMLDEGLPGMSRVWGQIDCTQTWV